MKISPHIFRAYDLRGLVGTDLSPEFMEHLGKAHGTYMKRHGIYEAVVGYDSRATSPEYADALIRGFSWAGVDTINIGMTMVGTFYWSQYYFKRKGGAFITASHNPAEYNGAKIAIDFSETLVSDGMNELRRMVEEEDYEKSEKKGKVEQQDILDAYIKDLKERISVTKKMRVVIDPSCSTAGVIVPKVLRAFGVEVIESNCNLDPTFPVGTPDPTEIAVAERLREKVLEEKADLGFSYDADGDRIGIVDDKGGIIWNDVLVALFSIDVLDKHPGEKIMYNTLCSKVVEDTIKKYGGVPFMWRTGHSFLKKKNQEVKAAFIGELSGHFFFSADFFNHDDGCYTTLRLLDYLSRSNQTLSQAVAGLPKYISSPEIKLGCADDKKAALIEKMSQVLIKDFPQAEVISDERAGDGVRLDLPDSMFVVRYSQNGPYLTIKFEAQTQERYDELKKYLNTFLHGYPEVDWKNNIVNEKSLE
ncbi:MAG: phosphomannomutase/phosphoglucomutase [Candidatus Moranbacteria bacterium]|nr:phosphomannomutase/phosphoglucomutase [Candidatus Moranbacteria bacterium]